MKAIQNTSPKSSKSRVNFSLMTLLGVLSLVALFCAALRFATGFWASVANSVTFLILGATAVWWLTSPSSDQTFWRGFQIAGWLYVLLAFSSGFNHAKLALLTVKGLSQMQFYMPFTSVDSVSIEWHGSWFPGSVLERRNQEYRIHYSGYGPEWDEWVDTTRIRVSGLNEFVEIGNAFFTLILAVLGGVLSKWLAWRDGKTMRLLFIAVTAGTIVLGCVALFVPTEMWASGLFTMVFFLLMAATVGVFAAGPSRSSFMVGFVLFGWMYFAVHFGPIASAASGPRLLTSALVSHARNWLHPSTDFTALPPAYVRNVSIGYSLQVEEPIDGFHVVAHSNLLLFAAVLGGFLGQFIAARRNDRPASDDRPTLKD
jgi:hypothetical protein